MKRNWREESKAIAALADELSEALAEIDASIIEKRVAGIGEMKAAIKKFKEENRDGIRQWNLGTYGLLFQLCGGKYSYELYSRNPADEIERILRKNHAATIEARNEKIAVKLLPLGVRTISGAIGRTNTGFSGTYKAETDQGPKTITIQVILAGGWNIQCLHYRTLVHVK